MLLAHNRFELVVGGIPKAPTAKSKPRWQEKIRKAAEEGVPPEWKLLAEEVSAVIIYFHRHAASGVDVDNMSKPILDALEGIVIEDDGFVVQLTARRTKLAGDLEIRNVSPELARGLDSFEDFVFVRISDPPDHGEIP
jgi:hypothetical protein